jgi:hypothetical protein
MAHAADVVAARDLADCFEASVCSHCAIWSRTESGQLKIVSIASRSAPSSARFTAYLPFQARDSSNRTRPRGRKVCGVWLEVLNARRPVRDRIIRAVSLGHRIRLRLNDPEAEPGKSLLEQLRLLFDGSSDEFDALLGRAEAKSREVLKAEGELAKAGRSV